MMKPLVLIAALSLTGCAAASIPDNIPPAPPKRTGAPITAPSNAPAEEPAMDGFGGDGFGGVTPTIEVEAAPAAADAEEASEEKEAEEGTEEPKEDGDAKAEPTEEAAPKPQ